MPPELQKLHSSQVGLRNHSIRAAPDPLPQEARTATGNFAPSRSYSTYLPLSLDDLPCIKALRAALHCQDGYCSCHCRLRPRPPVALLTTTGNKRGALH
jgi:hypothetical protein